MTNVKASDEDDGVTFDVTDIVRVARAGANKRVTGAYMRTLLGPAVRDGNGAPDDAVGLNGDYYIDTSNDFIWKRVAGVYATIFGNVVRPAAQIVACLAAGITEATTTAWSDPATLDSGSLTWNNLGGKFLITPRTFIARMTTSAVAMTGGTLHLEGISNQGEAIVEDIDLTDVQTAGSGFGVVTKCYARLINAIIMGPTVASGDPSDNQLTLLYGPDVGIPVPVDAVNLEVFSSSVDHDDPGVVDTDAATLTPTTDFDGVSDYRFYYKYEAPSV